MSSRLLAIDPGLSTGWSIWEDGELLGSGTFSVQRSRTRYADLQGHLIRLSREWGPPGWVAFEEPVVAGTGGRSIQRQLGIILMHAEQLEASQVDVNPSTLKKWATGSGRASKADMIRAARRWDPAVTQHDEADAILVGAWAWDSVEIG